MYAVINKFFVQPKHWKEFIKETKEVWIKGYKKSKGFVKTLLIQSRQNPKEWLTIDMWKSKKAADRFFATYGKDLLHRSWVAKRYVFRRSYTVIP